MFMYLKLSTQVFRLFSLGVRSGLPSEDRLINSQAQKRLFSLVAAPLPAPLAGQPRLPAHSDGSTWELLLFTSPDVLHTTVPVPAPGRASSSSHQRTLASI